GSWGASWDTAPVHLGEGRYSLARGRPSLCPGSGDPRKGVRALGADELLELGDGRTARVVRAARCLGDGERVADPPSLRDAGRSPREGLLARHDDGVHHAALVLVASAVTT